MRHIGVTIAVGAAAISGWTGCSVRRADVQATDHAPPQRAAQAIQHPARGIKHTAREIEIPCGKALSALHPDAGLTLAFRRNCSYQGTLTIASDHVTVTAYGSGSSPVFTLNRDGATIAVYASHVTIANLSLVGVAPGAWTCGGKRTPAGHVDGVDIESDAHDTVITNVSATGFYAGVYVMAGATRNLIERSWFTNNTELDTNNRMGSAGAFGVLLSGDDNRVADNSITGSQACSLAYARDGSAVEVYGGSHNLIAANVASNDNAFTELGSLAGRTATGNLITGNIISDGAGGLGTTFLITRGSADRAGPVYDTRAAGNTVRLTLPGDKGVVSYAWRRGDGTLLTLAGNYLDLGANRVLYQNGGYIDGGGNTFIGTCQPSFDCRSG